LGFSKLLDFSLTCSRTSEECRRVTLECIGVRFRGF
jgi:hypothetical protein